MTERERRRAKIERIKDRTSLALLHGHAELIGLSNGQAIALDKLPAPIDEFGIPRTEIMLDRLLGQMATGAYVWTGFIDTHHMATPKSDYTVVADGVGSRFRGLAPLKIDMPRQMHDLTHLLFEYYRPPTVGVMKQAILEVDQGVRISKIVSRADGDPDIVRRQVHDALYEMRDPEVNMIPSLDELAGMELDDLRYTVNSLISVQRYRSRRLVHPALRPQSLLRQKAA